MKKILNPLIALFLVIVFVFSFFYWREVFYTLLIITGSSILVLLTVFLFFYQKHTSNLYINRETKKKMKDITSSKTSSSFVYVHIIEIMEEDIKKPAKIVLTKYLNGKFKETKNLYLSLEENTLERIKEICYLKENQKFLNLEEVTKEIVEFKNNLPLIFLTSYELALLINSNNNYNDLGKENIILLNLIKDDKNLEQIEYLEDVYITSGLLSNSYQKAINIYLEKSDKK